MADKGIRHTDLDLTLAGRQSPPPEEQHPKQGREPPASGIFSQDKGQVDASAKDAKQGNKDTLKELPPNPERKARV